ncbi:MAG: IS982 family transposase [Bacteroidota bacterium]
MTLLELFCDVDDFCQLFLHHAQALAGRELGTTKRGPRCRMALSEVLTILIEFHRSSYRHFKAYYTQVVLGRWRDAFPDAVSYGRFVELMPSAVVPMLFYIQSLLGTSTGIAFIDSTALPVCHSLRIKSHRVFEGLAAVSKTSKGWYLGFKLHLLINERGELLAFHLTAGNVDDRSPVPEMVEGIEGKLYGDKGYISQVLAEQLREGGLELITPLRKNMKPKMLHLFDKLMLRKRALIETVNDQLKNISQICHTRHRSPQNFLANLLGGLIAYCFQPKKPSLSLVPSERGMLPAVI